MKGKLKVPEKHGEIELMDTSVIHQKNRLTLDDAHSLGIKGKGNEI